MIWKGKQINTYRELVELALSLKGAERKKLVNEYYKTHGEYAMLNIGHIAGYYPSKTAQRILDIFRTEHPKFGRNI
jgi:hypothetical protein